MTNKEAIKDIREKICDKRCVGRENCDGDCAINLAIEALEAVDGGPICCIDKFTKEYAKQMKERLNQVNWEEMSEQEKIEWIKSGKGLPKI